MTNTKMMKKQQHIYAGTEAEIFGCGFMGTNTTLKRKINWQTRD